MKPTVFLDSGIFIALMQQRDRWHTAAVALFDSGPSRWCTSVLVVSETYSWFLHRSGEESARTFRALLEQLRGLTIYEVRLRQHAATLQMLDRFRGAKLSYIDASSLVLLAEHRIRQVWSTDHHLGFLGAEILPRT